MIKLRIVQMWFWEQKCNTNGSKRLERWRKTTVVQRMGKVYPLTWLSMDFHLPHWCIPWVISFFKWIFFCFLLLLLPLLCCPRSTTQEWIGNSYIVSFSCSTYFYTYTVHFLLIIPPFHYWLILASLDSSKIWL